MRWKPLCWTDVPSGVCSCGKLVPSARYYKLCFRLYITHNTLLQAMSQSKHAVTWVSLAEINREDIPALLLEEICTYNQTTEFLIYLVLTVSKRQTALNENDCIWRVARIPIRETRPDIDGVRSFVHCTFIVIFRLFC